MQINIIAVEMRFENKRRITLFDQPGMVTIGRLTVDIFLIKLISM